MKKLLTLTMSLVALFLSTSSFATIWGTMTVCVGSTTYLIPDSVSSAGTWESNPTSVATIGVSTGVVTGITPGTAIITWHGTGPTSTSYATVTVNPNPSSIVGTSTVCQGATTPLSVTPSGGVWSSSPTTIGTVGGATGVFGGVSGGVCTVTYTLPAGGCFATKSMTVTPLSIDVISGPGSVCLTSTITLTSSLSGSGGTWSSSAPAIGSVSSAGVVGGVTTGAVVITHIATTGCGTVSATHSVTVVSSPSAGTLSGPTTVATGSSITLSSTISGGVWSNACASIATIGASTGIVTGVSAGTCTMTYTVTTSCGTASATYIVTDTAVPPPPPPNCISGMVHFTGASYTGNVKVWLIHYDVTTHLLTAIDSQVVYCSDSVAGYSFCGMGTDSFRVKASRSPNTAGTGYLPTYHTSSAYWNTATVIHHTSGTSDVNKDITMLYGTVSSGPGFIGGDVTTGANKGTAGGPPAVGMLVYCVDDVTGAILATQITDAAGHYSFTGLPLGEPFKIYPEAINYATTPYPPITLTSGTYSVTAANFIQHTISMTITPVTAAVGTVTSTNTSINVFPNPASGSLNIQWNVANAGTGTATITDITGRVVLSSLIDMNQNNGKLRLDISGINAGMYIVSIKANGVNYNTKVTIQ